MTETPEITQRLQQVEARLADVRARLPKHTPPPSMLIEIDELEDEAARLRALLSAHPSE